jgi:UDP-4-amino-4-deoxy-L-arabinose-oxoglutarate aminotransferase
MVQVRAFADKHGLKVVEDAAHALEARIFTPDGRTIAPGDLADAAVFSFYATKSITSGEGGAIVTDDDGLADRLRVMRLHGISKGAAERYGTDYQHYDMVDFGWKYNMSNIQAAMLIGQLPRAEALRARREKLDSLYRQALADIEGVTMPSIPPGARSGHHLFTIWVEPKIRDAVLAGLGKRGVGVAVNYRPIHLMSWYREKFGFRPGMFPNAERIGASTISLPFYPKLTESEVEYVAASVREVVREASRREHR